MATNVDIKDQPALLRLRKRLDNPAERINNASLRAGSPMFFYCKMCGAESDRVPEGYISSPKKICNDCKELKEVNPFLTETTIVEAAKAIRFK